MDKLAANAPGPWRRGRFLMDDGIELAADIGGPDGAPSVLLAHGGGQTRNSWSGAMKALVEKGYRVVNFDARGHGESEWSRNGDYSFSRRCDDFVSVARQVGNPVAFVGASMGGSNALDAIIRGLRPAALVLVDIVPRPEDEGVARILSFMRGHADGFATPDEAADAVAAYNPTRTRPKSTEGLLKNLRQSVDGRYFWHWDPKMIEIDVERERDLFLARLQKAASAITTPILVVRGLRSDVVSDAGIAEFRQQIPSVEVYDVGGAGHMIAGDRNDAFNTGVIEFLERHMPLENGRI